MWNFGFELEGFHVTEGNNVELPPRGYPTDDFPGLIEVRTIGGKNLEDSYYELLNQVRKYPADYTKHEHVFNGAQMNKIRARHYEKGGVEISNIYGKVPKLKGNKTLASFQINISNGYKNKEGAYISYPIDFVPIIRRLDKEFAEEIKSSNRQPGFYSIKDNCRVEYRSLPNFVFRDNPQGITLLLKRIESCLQEKD